MWRITEPGHPKALGQERQSLRKIQASHFSSMLTGYTYCCVPMLLGRKHQKGRKIAKQENNFFLKSKI